MSTPWWKDAVVYQIYPRSFADTDGDGVGDLEGIRRHLDHLAWLGVDAIWVSPFFPSPMKDFGYDVADYCDVDPRFGTLDDFDRLLAGAHERGIRALIDWVPNHTSDLHPWFVESRSSRDNPKAGWYLWKDPDPDAPTKPPTNWKAAFTGGSAWQWDTTREQWYLHLFLPEQPDLDWRNPDVKEAMHGTLRFWLDRGVDGFRVDVVHGLLKDEAWPDLDETTEAQRHVLPTIFDVEGTIDLVRGFRKVLEEYDGDRVMVGEVYLLSTAQVARYYGDGDALHLAFNFPPLYAPWAPDAWRRRIQRVADELDRREAWPTWVLSNHDNPRHRTRYGGSEARARAAAVLLLTLRGTPFLYAGEELGLEDAVVPPARAVDPGGRDGCRAPIPWTPHAGKDDLWLPWPPDVETRNAATLRDDPASILHLYRRLLAARRNSPALRRGTLMVLPSPDGVLAYERVDGETGDRRVVLINFTEAPIALGRAEASMLASARPKRGGDGGDGFVVEVASDGQGEGDLFTDGVAGGLAGFGLAGDRAVVLVPVGDR